MESNLTAETATANVEIEEEEEVNPNELTKEEVTGIREDFKKEGLYLTIKGVRDVLNELNMDRQSLSIPKLRSQILNVKKNT